MSTDAMKDSFRHLVVTDEAAQLLGCTKEEIADMDMEALAYRIFDRGLYFSITANEADTKDIGKLTISCDVTTTSLTALL